MCFNTSNTKSAKQNEERFDSTFNIPEVYQPYYHTAGYEPNYLYIIKQNEFDIIEPAYWGLMPENVDISERSTYLSKRATYNKRSESIFGSSYWTKIAMEQRCLILADGFFEKIHNIKKQGTFRMPIVLNEGDEINWLNEDLHEGDVNELLATMTKKDFEAYPVTRELKGNNSDLLKRVEYSELNKLF